MSLFAALAGLYLSVWPQDGLYLWASMFALACLVPVTVAALVLGHTSGRIVAWIGSAAVLVALGRSWLLGRPAGMLAGLAAAALLLPVWIFVLFRLQTRSRQPEARPSQLACLSQIADLFRFEASLPQTLQQMARSIGEGLGFPLVLIGLVEGESPQLCIKACYGPDATCANSLDQTPFHLDDLQEVMRDAFRVSQSYRLPFDHPGQMAHTLRASGVVTQTHGLDGWLLVPTYGRDRRMTGMIVTTWLQTGAPSDVPPVETLQILAQQISTTVDNYRLYESMAQRVRQLSTLNDIGKTVISSLDIDVTLDLIMNRVAEAFNVESGSLLLIKEGKLEFTVSFGPAGDQIKPLTLELGQGIAGWVALSGESVLVSDVKADRRHFAGMDQATGYQTRSMLCVPLKGAQNQAIGVIQIINPRDGHTFTRHDQELLESMATFAVVAIQNAQLYQQAQYSVADLSSLYEVGKAITSSLDIEDTLQLIANETARLTAAARSRIVLFDSHAQRVTHVVQHGYDGADLEQSYNTACQGLNGWVCSEKTPAISTDITRDERMQGLPIEQITGPDAESVIVAPLLIQNEPVGTLTAVRLQNDEPFAWRELELLNMMAGQAAIAIENAHLFEERERQITELSILNQTGQALSSTLEPKDLMDLIHSQVALVMDASNFYIALYDADHDSIYFPLVYERSVDRVGPNKPVKPVEWQPRQHGRGLTEHLIDTRQALWIPDRFAERLAELGLELIGEPARSWLGVPILWGDQVLGVIAVQSYERENVYDHDHLRLLMTIASQAAAAIRNAQLFTKLNSMTENLENLVQERTMAVAQVNRDLTVERDRLNVLYLVMRELSSSLEPEQSLDHTLPEICRVVEAQQGYILLHDAATETFEYAAVEGQPPDYDGRPFPSPRIGDRIDYRRDTGLIGWLTSRQSSLRVGDLQGERHWQIIANQDCWHRSALAAPLVTGHDTVGAILLYHAEPEHFTPEHQRMLDTIASQVAAALSNAEMFRLLREAAERLSKMLRAQQLEAAKSQAILEGVADGVMVTDASGEIILFNAAAERILQIERTDIIGRSVSQMSGILGLAGTSWSELTARWGQGSAQVGEDVLYDEQLEIEERVISMRVAPVTRQGAFEGTVAVFRDITKDVEVDRMKSEFVSSVSHELRTPMTSIKGYIDLLYSGMAGPVSDEQKRFLQIVKTNADRLTLLVNDLLDISRIETGRLRLSIEAVDPVNVINTVIANHLPETVRREQKLTCAIEGLLPHVSADPARMIQILTNLVSNAIYYTPAGGTITISTEVIGGFLHIHVQDTGVGIKEEDKAKLFSRFFRADTPLVQARSGTGLGLTIVKSIVELHGGEIWFESTFGQGSRFSFCLPLADQSRAEAPREFKTISYRPQDKHILIVESDLDIADRLAHQLRSQGGYRVHIEHTGREALTHLTLGNRRTDLVLLDLDLPDVGGLDALDDILSHRALSAIPVIALSLSSHEQDHPRAYLSRPVRTSQLLDAVKAVFAERAEDVDQPHGRMLIVEEEPQLAELFTMVLADKGFVTTIQKEPDQVLKTARIEQPHLILLDVRRSEMDGYELLRRLKDAPETRSIPVLVIKGNVTAEPQQDIQVSTLQFSDGPVQVDDLVNRIKNVLDGNYSDDETSPS